MEASRPNLAVFVGRSNPVTSMLKDDSGGWRPAASALLWARSSDAELAQAYITIKHVYLRAQKHKDTHLWNLSHPRQPLRPSFTQLYRIKRKPTWK